MATSYDPTLSTPKDHVRLLLGDNGVDGGSYLLQDEEINANVTALGFNLAVAQLAESLATRFAQYPDETDTAGGTRLSWRTRVSAWQTLAKTMRTQGASADPTKQAPIRKAARVGQLGSDDPGNLRTSGPGGLYGDYLNPFFKRPY